MLYVSLGSKVRPITFGCVAMGSALLCILRSSLLFYFAGFGVNRVQVALSGFSKRLFCLHYVCMIVCIYWLPSCLCV